MAAVDDNIREVEWRDLADTVLIFVCLSTPIDKWLFIWFQDGLFAAFLSAFLVFLIPQLQSNSTDVSMDVLIHISQQLSNSSTPAFEPTAFQISSNAAVVNTLFFFSLALVLIDAFLAMLVKGWLQEFDRGWRKYTVAHLRAQERERRLQELERWKLHELVALLPILIQGSLLLFCIGLLVLIFPLHSPSAILFSLAFVFVVGFYGFTTYVSVVNNYAPFSSPVSRLLARGLAILQTSYPYIAQRIPSVIRFHNRPPVPSQDQGADPDTSHDTLQPSSSKNGVAKHVSPRNPDNIKKSTVVPRSRSNIDPQMHVHVLERLFSTTPEAVDNIPIFLELLDQPVKDATLRPFNVEKWKELLYITLGLLTDKSTFSVSAAWTLTRTMMICYTQDTVDPQLCLTLQHHLGSWETDYQRPRMSLNGLLSFYLHFWLGHASLEDLSWNIAFLEPSDAADAELLWLVNTFHRAVRSEERFHGHLKFYAAVLTYISSTEQSRRSNVPLTAAVIHAMHTVRSALDQGGIDSIGGLCILPGTISTSGPAPITFFRVAGIDALDPWSEDCIQIVTDLLQWDWGSEWHNEIQLSLIAALYVDSIKQAHARPTFSDLLKYTRITNIWSIFSNVYDHGKLAGYWYMTLSQKPLDQDCHPLAALYDVIENAITGYSTLQLSGLHVLEIAVQHVQKTERDWLLKGPLGLCIVPGRSPMMGIDHWVLLHLDTILAPQRYLLPEEAEELKWSDTPEKVHIANARLDLYDSFARAGHEGADLPEPEPELLRMFLWSKDTRVCTRAFKWCLELFTISQQRGASGDRDSTRMFIPETIGYEWVEHFVHVLSMGDYWDHVTAWRLLKSHLVPKWDMLPSSWCCDFASIFLFSIEHPLYMHGLPAYQPLAESITIMARSDGQKYLPFLTTMLQTIKSRLTWAGLNSLESWLTSIPERLENQDAHTRMDDILATRKQELVEETLGFFAELPMAGSWMNE